MGKRERLKKKRSKSWSKTGEKDAGAIATSEAKCVCVYAPSMFKLTTQHKTTHDEQEENPEDLVVVRV